MDLNQLRLEIDKIDDELVRLFVQRMEVSARIGDYKKAHNLPILVPERELQKLQDVAQKAGVDMEVYTRVLYSMLFELSRGYQAQLSAARTPLYERISDAVANTPKLLPKGAAVACLGVSDENATMICGKLFGETPVMQFKNMEGILSAVVQGMCRYGVLPLENGKKQIYDLLAEQTLYIVRRFRLSVGRRYLCFSK